MRQVFAALEFDCAAVEGGKSGPYIFVMQIQIFVF
jgi:hypothetical protein